MKILVTGSGGLLGGLLAPGGLALTRAQLDVTHSEAIARALDTHRPAALINAAAQARVDLAEREPTRTYAVNAQGPGLLAAACAERGIRLVHLSTDYVLDGPDTPGHRLDEGAPVHPRSVYAASKLAGEELVLAEPSAVVVRIQWVYAPGRPGFFTRSMEALARGEELGLVTDQVGVPTAGPWLARALLACAAGEATGLFHLACAGEATAWEWIEAGARALGLPFRARPLTRAELGGAWRPARSVLDPSRFARSFGVAIPHWEAALKAAVALRAGPR